MALASERLLALLVREIAAFEADVAGGEDYNHKSDPVELVADVEPAAGGVAADGVPTGAKRRVAGGPAAVKRGAAKAGAVDAKRMGPKERIEHIGQMAKVLEKLLELRRLETLAAAGGPQDDAEAARLGAELLSRLRSLDARRRHGELLFGPAASADAAGEAEAVGANDAVGDGGPASELADATDAAGGGQ